MQSVGIVHDNVFVIAFEKEHQIIRVSTRTNA